VALLYALGYPDAIGALVLLSMGPVGAAVLANRDALGSPLHATHGRAATGVPLAVEPAVLGRPRAEWRQLRPGLWSYWKTIACV
jgi:pimeloyl-ACP methyl ester carboxylesterase